MTCLRLNTNPGLEQFLVQDLVHRGRDAGLWPAELKLRPLGQKGWVQWEVDAPLSEMLEVALGCKVAHHVRRPLALLDLEGGDDLAQIAEALGQLDIPELQPEQVSFRVTGHRQGQQAYTSVQLAAAAGAAIARRCPRKVRMRGYDVDVHVEVLDGRCLISVQHTRRPLSQWMSRPFEPRVSLRPSVAWALLRLACPKHPPRALLDPFCGAGTMLLVGGQMWPETELFGSDVSETKVEGTQQNLDALQISAEIRRGDARDLPSLWQGQRFDAVVSNPPFGKRMAAHVDFDRLYWRLLEGMAQLLEPGSPVVLLILERMAFKRALRECDEYKVKHARVLDLGGIFPVMYLLERS